MFAVHFGIESLPVSQISMCADEYLLMRLFGPMAPVVAQAGQFAAPDRDRFSRFEANLELSSVEFVGPAIGSVTHKLSDLGFEIVEGSNRGAL